MDEFHSGEESGITDEDLTSLALAADRDAPIPPDAVPIDVFLPTVGGSLPLWYMPPVTRSGGRWKRPVVFVVIAAFLLIDAMGLCNTYGILSLA